MTDSVCDRCSHRRKETPQFMATNTLLSHKPSHTLTHPRTPSHTLAHPCKPSYTLTHPQTPPHTLRHPRTPSHTVSHLRTLFHTLAHHHTPPHTTAHPRTLHDTLAHQPDLVTVSVQNLSSCGTLLHIDDTVCDGKRSARRRQIPCVAFVVQWCQV